jgi:hypothetical protein
MSGPGVAGRPPFDLVGEKSRCGTGRTRTLSVSTADSWRGSSATSSGPVPGDVGLGERYGELVRGSDSMNPRPSFLSASV